LELGEQNANQMNEKDTVLSLQSASGEKIADDECCFNKQELIAVIPSVIYENSDHR
jgi:hypothetical protein